MYRLSHSTLLTVVITDVVAVINRQKRQVWPLFSQRLSTRIRPSSCSWEASGMLGKTLVIYLLNILLSTYYVPGPQDTIVN